MTGSQDTYLSFVMVTRLQTRPMHHGEIPGRGKRFLSYPDYSNWLWRPPSLLIKVLEAFPGHVK